VSEADNVHVDRRRPGYEVWFLTFTDPASGHGHWIRYSYHVPERGSSWAAVWFARFDAADPDGTFGVVKRFDEWSISTAEFDVRTPGGSISSGHADGSLEADGRRISWSLTFPFGDETYRLLPDALYHGGLAPTRPTAPNPDTTITGSVVVDGVAHSVAEAPGQQGHLVGSRHADRWAWAHCSTFLDEDAVLHALTARSHRGPLHTPYLTTVGLRWGGRWIRFRSTSRTSDFGLGVWRVDVANRHYRLTGRVEAPTRSMIRARYEDPDGRERWCHNSEIASSRLALFERRRAGFEEVALLESRGTTHAEWAGLTPAATVERAFGEVPGPGSTS
jgi:hypothetical protein